MKWLIDEGIPKLIVDWLCERGDDVLDVTNSSYVSEADDILWRIAGAEKRFVLTRDLGFLWPNLEPHPAGIVLFRVPDNWRAKEITMLVRSCLEDRDPATLVGCVTLIEPGRIRQHSLRGVAQPR